MTNSALKLRDRLFVSHPSFDERFHSTSCVADTTSFPFRALLSRLLLKQAHRSCQYVVIELHWHFRFPSAFRELFVGRRREPKNKPPRSSELPFLHDVSLTPAVPFRNFHKAFARSQYAHRYGNHVYGGSSLSICPRRVKLW